MFMIIKLILSRSTLKIPISLAKNVTLLNVTLSSLKKGISSLVSKASWNFSSILLVTNQSGTNFNADKQPSTASS